MDTSNRDLLSSKNRTAGAAGGIFSSLRSVIAIKRSSNALGAKFLTRRSIFKSNSSASAHLPAQGTSLAEHLLILVSAVALPLMLLGGGALWLQYRSERQAAEAQLVEQARSTVRLVDREFERTLAVGATLAHAVPAAKGDLNVLETELRDARDFLSMALPRGATLPVISLIDANGAWLLHTSWPPGERRSGQATPFGRAAMAEGKPMISNLFTGITTPVPVVGIAVPIFAPDRGGGGHPRVTGGIGISIPRERLLAIVRQAGLPPGAIASILDRSGVIVARSDQDAEMVGRSPVSAILQTISKSGSGLIPPFAGALNHVSSTIAFARAPLSGYTLTLDVPGEVFLGSLRRSLFRSAAIGILVLIVGLALAVACARKISTAFRRVLATASELPGAPPAVRISTGLREADQLALLLQTTMAERESATRNAQEMFEQSPIGIVVFDTGGRIHAANDAFMTIVGHTRAAIRTGALKWNDLMPESLASEDAPASDSFANAHSTPYETVYLRPDGRPAPVLVSFGVTDKARGMLTAFVMDLTEQRRHEMAHRDAQEQLSFSLKAGGLGAWDLDLTSWKMRCSEQAQRLYGRFLDRETTLDEVLAAVHRDDRERVRDAINRATANSSDFHAEYRVVWPDKTVHWLEARGRVVQPRGMSAKLAGISADVTARKEADAALADSETRLRAITDTMPQIVWSARPDGYHDYHNQRWYDLTGLDPAQTQVNQSHSVFHPDDRERAWTQWRHCLETGEPFQVEYRLRAADGSYRWMLGRALPVKDPDTGKILRWFGTCTDIEETVAAREAFARSREELERLVDERTRDLQATQIRLAQAQRLQALGQLAGGIAHDFNNVLQAIQSGGSLLERDPTDPAGVRRHASTILEATERGAAITRRLLAFSRRGDLRAEAVHPAALQMGLRDILEHTLGDGVKVELELGPDLPALVADKGQLETVLVNLATNGRDAMAGIGTLTLSAHADTVSVSESAEHIAGLKPGAYVRLSVSDTGGGMDAHTLARASEPFFTTKPAGKGTGLGLAMARGFAEQSGGGLHISSALGKGTTVSLWFPVATTDLPVAGTPDRDVTSQLVRIHGAKVLLVDDDEIVREVTSELLEGLGCIVLQAESATTALAILASTVEVDILLSDLSMPDIDGITLIREAQLRRPGLPAILLTGFATDDIEVKEASAGAIGACALIRKPVRAHVLAAQVSAMLEGIPAAQ